MEKVSNFTSTALYNYPKNGCGHAICVVNMTDSDALERYRVYITPGGITPWVRLKYIPKIVKVCYRTSALISTSALCSTSHSHHFWGSMIGNFYF